MYKFQGWLVYCSWRRLRIQEGIVKDRMLRTKGWISQVASFPACFTDLDDSLIYSEFEFPSLCSGKKNLIPPTPEVSWGVKIVMLLEAF